MAELARRLLPLCFDRTEDWALEPEPDLLLTLDLRWLILPCLWMLIWLFCSFLTEKMTLLFYFATNFFL